MKFTLALAFLLAVGAVYGSTDVEGPVQYDTSDTDQYEYNISPVVYDAADVIPVQNPRALSVSPIQFDTNSSPLEFELDEGRAVARNRLLHRAQFIRGAVANTVLIHDHTWRGSSSNVITSVRAAQVGANQGAAAWITSGGVGWNFVTVRIQSQRGRGFNVLIEIYGR